MGPQRKEIGPEFIVQLFPGWLYYVSLCCLIFGNFAFAYIAMVSARATASPRLDSIKT